MRKNKQSQSKKKKSKKSKESANGPWGCKSKIVVQIRKDTQAQPKDHCLQPPATIFEKTRAMFIIFQLLIPGFLAKTHNTTNVQHEETILTMYGT